VAWRQAATNARSPAFERQNGNTHHLSRRSRLPRDEWDREQSQEMAGETQNYAGDAESATENRLLTEGGPFLGSPCTEINPRWVHWPEQVYLFLPAFFFAAPLATFFAFFATGFFGAGFLATRFFGAGAGGGGACGMGAWGVGSAGAC